MNKKCPVCGKKVTRRQPHAFYGGKRYHDECLRAVEKVAKYRGSVVK